MNLNVYNWYVDKWVKPTYSVTMINNNNFF